MEFTNKPGITSRVSLNNFSDPIRVLLADDDDDDRELFEEIISVVNPAIQLQTAVDGLQLMNMLNRENIPLPDVIFLDLNMPGKNGKECLREIKKDKKLQDIPVIIYSTSSYPKDIAETHLSGAQLYISKPGTFSDLESVIKKVFALDFRTLDPHPPINNFVIPIK
jgi:CheY-like chemotaxis protein